MKLYQFFNLLIILLIIGTIFFVCGQITTGPNSSFFTGITRTTANGDIIEEDPEDWQPRMDVSNEPLTVSPAYPNPTNRNITLGFRLLTSMHVKITVNNAPNNVVLTIQNQNLPAGMFLSHVDLPDLNPGIYRVYFEGRIAGGITYKSFGDIQIIE
jgi:hypothetical protein